MQQAAKEPAPPRDERRVLWYLRKIPLFEGVGLEPLKALAATVEIREFRRRQIVYLPGDPGEHVFFLQGGRVKCSKVSRDGKELTLDYHGPGAFFGELCLFAGAPREEMAEAMKNAIVAQLPREELRDLIFANSELAFRFAEVLAQRRRSAETKLEHFVFRDVHAKLAALLLELGREYGQETEEGVKVDLKITHQEMANLIGSTRETISLALASFRKRNLVNLQGRTVVLVDREGLAALC
jgi:CRP/FNR family cyclic AMP-dependent transcriptional regulator